MFRTFIINLAWLVYFNVAAASDNWQENSQKGWPFQVSLKNQVNNLFSHEKHSEILKDMQVRCIDCHSFSVKSLGKGPLSPQVKQKYLKPQKKVCHQCHLNKVSMPVPNQCQLCHNQLEKLKPQDHRGNWEKHHGMMASHNSDSCMQCHGKDGCSECHLKRDNMNPRVHRGNFRFTHSIEARSNPASCVLCHQAPSFCIDCHLGVRR